MSERNDRRPALDRVTQLSEELGLYGPACASCGTVGVRMKQALRVDFTPLPDTFVCVDAVACYEAMLSGPYDRDGGEAS